MSTNLFCFTEKFEAALVLLDLVDGSVELHRLTVWRKDVCPEKVCDPTLLKLGQTDIPYIAGACASIFFIQLEVLTVSTRPTRTNPKLKLCCVARAAFSGAESSLHGTYPSSLNGVTLRRFGPKGVDPWVFCVANDRAMGIEWLRRVVAPRKLVAGRRAAREVTGFMMPAFASPCPHSKSVLAAED